MLSNIIPSELLLVVAFFSLEEVGRFIICLKRTLPLAAPVPAISNSAEAALRLVHFVSIRIDILHARVHACKFSVAQV